MTPVTVTSCCVLPCWPLRYIRTLAEADSLRAGPSADNGPDNEDSTNACRIGIVCVWQAHSYTFIQTCSSGLEFGLNSKANVPPDNSLKPPIVPILYPIRGRPISQAVRRLKAAVFDPDCLRIGLALSP